MTMKDDEYPTPYHTRTRGYDDGEDDDTIAKRKQQDAQRKKHIKRKRIEFDMEEKGHTYDTVEFGDYDFNDDQLEIIDELKAKRDQHTASVEQAKTSSERAKTFHLGVMTNLASLEYVPFETSHPLDILAHRTFYEKGDLKLNTPIKVCLLSSAVPENFGLTFNLGKPPSPDIYYALPE